MVKELSRNESEQLIRMLSTPHSASLALDILINTDKKIHSTCANKLATISNNAPRHRPWWETAGIEWDDTKVGTWREWDTIRAKHWSPRWRNLGLIEIDRHTYNMDDLKARSGDTPPKKKRVVLVQVNGTYAQGRYCGENNSWLVSGKFVKPKRVTWYKEVRPAKKSTKIGAS